MIVPPALLCHARPPFADVTGGPTEPGGTTPPPPPLVPLLVAPAFEHRPHQGHRVRELPYPHHRCGRPAGRSVGPPQYAPPYRRSPTSLAAPLNPSAPNPPPPPLVPPRVALGDSRPAGVSVVVPSDGTPVVLPTSLLRLAGIVLRFSASLDATWLCASPHYICPVALRVNDVTRRVDQLVGCGV